MKKRYVLWVVHTSLVSPSLPDDFLERHLDNRTFSDYILKSAAHRETLIGAIKAAQKAHITVVYEVTSKYEQNDFLKYIEKRGVDINYIKRLSAPPKRFAYAAVELLLKKMKDVDIEDFEIIFCGHYGDIDMGSSSIVLGKDGCITQRAKLLKKRKFTPYLLRGRATFCHDDAEWQKLQTFFGKDRLITVNQMRNLK